MPSQPVFPVQYNVPRINVALPGRQFRSGRGEMRITPGVTEPFEFAFGNMDGIPITLVGWSIRLIFWYQTEEYDRVSANYGQNGIVLVKLVEISDPHNGKCTILLSDRDTEKLGATNRQSLRWSLYLLDQDNQVFPAQITADGTRYGIARIDQSGMPSGEMIRGAGVA